MVGHVPPWMAALRRAHLRARVAWALCLLVLFALAAPGISGWLSATNAGYEASPELCAEHREHLPEGACDGASSHNAHGVHCGFCLLFSHAPVVAGAVVRSFDLQPPPPLARPAGEHAGGVHDAAVAWMRWRKHGPPASG